MTEQELRQKVANQAISWGGVKEGTTAFKNLLDIYNAIDPLPVGYKLDNADPWCAAFVSVIASQCGLLDILYPECSCGRMLDTYKRHGFWVEDDGFIPQVGDLIFYGWNDAGSGDYMGFPNHVGIVIQADHVSMSVMEGNYQNMVRSRALKINDRFIRGFATPDYASKATAEGAPVEGVLEERELTDEECYDILQRAMQYAATLPLPDYARVEFREAMEAGITDGTRPNQLATRWQAALMAYRAKSK